MDQNFVQNVAGYAGAGVHHGQAGVASGPGPNLTGLAFVQGVSGQRQGQHAPDSRMAWKALVHRFITIWCNWWPPGRSPQRRKVILNDFDVTWDGGLE